MKAYFTQFLLCSIFLQASLFAKRDLFAETDSLEYPLDRVTKKITRIMKQKAVPGVACAIFYQGQGYVLCYGLARKEPRLPVTPNTIFDLASITKVFTTTELALQVRSGTMALQDPVEKYIDVLKHTPIGRTALLALATHTAALPSGIAQVKTKEELFAFLKQWNPPYKAGKSYRYSNSGFWLLRYALEDIDGLSYEQMLKKDLFTPLAMTSTTITIDPSNAFRSAQGYTATGLCTGIKPIGPGGGTLKSTATDMLRFLQANLGVKVGQKLGSAMQLAQQGQFRVNDHLVLGLAWQRFCKSGQAVIVDKNGKVPGFSSYIGLVLQEGIGVVILANQENFNATSLGRAVLLELASYGNPQK